MKKYLFYFALVGWFLGLLVHSLSLADIDVSDKVPFVWLLHIGVFVVWIPVVFNLRKNDGLQEYQQLGMLSRMNPVGFFKIIFKETPTWMVIIAMAGFFYALINFALFASSQVGTPDIKEGQFILQNHGKFIKALTEQEYHHYKANELRGFSGHWILFYGIATAVLYKFSGLSKTEVMDERVEAI